MEETAWKPSLLQTFSSFSEFEKLLEGYSERTFTEWVTGSSRSVELENKLLRARNAPEIDVKFKYKYLTYTCKCGGKDRRGIRVNESSFKIGCPGKIAIKFNHILKKLQLYEVNLWHSHPVTPNVKASFPESRKLNNDEEKAVQNLLKATEKPTMIRNLLGSVTSKKLTSRDIANQRAKMKREALGGRSEEEKLSDTLQEITDADPDSNIHIGQDDQGNLEYLFFQTSEMKRNVVKYPSVVIMDKINKNQKPFVVFTVLDGHGSGCVGGYVFVVNELKVTRRKLLGLLMESLARKPLKKLMCCGMTMPLPLARKKKCKGFISLILSLL